MRDASAEATICSLSEWKILREPAVLQVAQMWMIRQAVTGNGCTSSIWRWNDRPVGGTNRRVLLRHLYDRVGEDSRFPHGVALLAHQHYEGEDERAHHHEGVERDAEKAAFWFNARWSWQGCRQGVCWPQHSWLATQCATKRSRRDEKLNSTLTLLPPAAGHRFPMKSLTPSPECPAPCCRPRKTAAALRAGNTRS